MSVIDNASSRRVHTSINQSGFNPQLFLVASGSYADPGYGSGAASTGTYDDQPTPVTVRSSSNAICQTGAKIRKQDTDIDFDIAICLDATQADPFTMGSSPTDEVRIGILPSVIPVRGLGMSSGSFGLPLFLDVEIVDESGVIVLPTAANTVLQARLLHGGQLALVQYLASGPPVASALTAADIGAHLGNMTPGTLIRIHVSGQYRGRGHI